MFLLTMPDSFVSTARSFVADTTLISHSEEPAGTLSLDILVAVQGRAEHRPASTVKRVTQGLRK